MYWKKIGFLAIGQHKYELLFREITFDESGFLSQMSDYFHEINFASYLSKNIV